MKTLRKVARWVHHHPHLIAYLILAVGFVGCLVALQANYDEDVARDCRARREGREVLRDIVILSTSGQGVDYSVFPSYAELDPATQAFLTEVSNASRDGRLSTFRDQALAKLALPVCAAERVTTTTVVR